MKRRIQFSLLLAGALFTLETQAQLKSYKLNSKGDTINKIDRQNLKQGYWIERTEALRGNPGFEESGEYVDGKKEGKWMRFSLMGDPIGYENYKFNLKNGKQVYYNMVGPLREESWRAILPSEGVDSVEVTDLHDESKITWVKIENDGRSVKDGEWKFYNPNSGAVVKTEKWQRGKQVVAEQQESTAQYNTSQKTPSDSAKKIKPAVVQDFEKKNAGKKRVRSRDGQTGGGGF